MKRKKGGGRTWRCARLVTGWCLSANGDLDLVSWAYMWKQLWARGRAWSVLNSWLVWFNVYCVLPAGKRCGGFDAFAAKCWFAPSEQDCYKNAIVVLSSRRGLEDGNVRKW
jgi:hypothetical protein